MTAVGVPRAPAAGARRPRLRRRLRRVLQVGHRWAAVVAGLVLLVVVLSGVALVLDREIDRALHPGLYRSTPSEHPIAPEQALAVVRRARPDLTPNDIVWNRGHWEVYAEDYMVQAHVDPGTGRPNGVASHDTGVMGFLQNLHMCALSCPDYPGHLAFLEHPVPLLGNAELTVAGLILAATGVLLIALCVSPGVRRMARGLRLRRGKGRYALHDDLHKLVGLAAIPFLSPSTAMTAARGSPAGRRTGRSPTGCGRTGSSTATPATSSGPGHARCGSCSGSRRCYSP